MELSAHVRRGFTFTWIPGIIFPQSLYWDHCNVFKSVGEVDLETLYVRGYFSSESRDRVEHGRQWNVGKYTYMPAK